VPQEIEDDINSFLDITAESKEMYSIVIGNNSDLIKHVANLYLQNEDKIADITYGKGAFWRKVDLSQYDFHPSDLITCPKTRYDFRKLPYADNSFDVVVFDPPYAHNPGKMIVDDNYKNAKTTKGLYHNDILELYREGMQESYRILKPNGTLWVKGQDEVESGYQRWSHVEHLLMALDMGMYGKDLFILGQNKNPVIQNKKQQHARKKHSYLWIFKKPIQSELKALKRYGLTLNNFITTVIRQTKLTQSNEK